MRGQAIELLFYYWDAYKCPGWLGLTLQADFCCLAEARKQRAMMHVTLPFHDDPGSVQMSGFATNPRFAERLVPSVGQGYNRKLPARRLYQIKPLESS